MKIGKKIIICCSILMFFIIIGTIGIILYWYYNINKTSCGPKHKVEWQDSQCYEKCMDGCSYEGCHILGWDCGNECTLRCETPKYKSCISKCKDLEVDGYDEEHYYERFSENKVWSRNSREYDERLEIEERKRQALPKKYKYNERVEETFPGYKEDIEKYESCKSTCGEEPRIIPWN